MSRLSLSDLEKKDDFIRRHVGPGDSQIEQMLKTIGVKSLNNLINRTVPASIHTNDLLNVPESISERYALSVLRRMSERNKVFISMIGMGYYGTVIPNVILRNVLENPGWYTAYTPYQPEVSQGRLEALLNFQQAVTDLTGMDLANASLLDEATASAEAMAMAKRLSKKKDCNTFFIDENCHPQTISVLKTRADLAGYNIQIGDPWITSDYKSFFGILIQYPASTGQIKDPSFVIEKVNKLGVISCVATDLLALALLKTPGEMGADIVLGSAQRTQVLPLVI